MTEAPAGPAAGYENGRQGSRKGRGGAQQDFLMMLTSRPVSSSCSRGQQVEHASRHQTSGERVRQGAARTKARCDWPVVHLLRPALCRNDHRQRHQTAPPRDRPPSARRVRNLPSRMGVRIWLEEVVGRASSVVSQMAAKSIIGSSAPAVRRLVRSRRTISAAALRLN